MRFLCVLIVVAFVALVCPFSQCLDVYRMPILAPAARLRHLRSKSSAIAGDAQWPKKEGDEEEEEMATGTADEDVQRRHSWIPTDMDYFRFLMGDEDAKRHWVPRQYGDEYSELTSGNSRDKAYDAKRRNYQNSWDFPSSSSSSSSSADALLKKPVAADAATPGGKTLGTPAPHPAAMLLTQDSYSVHASSNRNIHQHTRE